MPLDPIHAFYCRKDYLTLAQYCKIKSGGICARCGGVFDIDELRPHHITELTLDNIDDVNITLNPANIEVLCKTLLCGRRNAGGIAKHDGRRRNA